MEFNYYNYDIAANRSWRFIEMAVRCACDIRGSSSLKEKQVEAITALMRERDVFVCLPTGSISRCCAMHS